MKGKLYVDEEGDLIRLASHPRPLTRQEQLKQGLEFLERSLVLDETEENFIVKNILNLRLKKKNRIARQARASYFSNHFTPSVESV